MSLIDTIKFKIKEVFWIRNTVELPGPSPVLCPRLTGGSQHPLPPAPAPSPRYLHVFLKPLCPNFVWIHHWDYWFFYLNLKEVLKVWKSKIWVLSCLAKSSSKITIYWSLLLLKFSKCRNSFVVIIIIYLVGSPSRCRIGRIMSLLIVGHYIYFKAPPITTILLYLFIL